MVGDGQTRHGFIFKTVYLEKERCVTKKCNELMSSSVKRRDRHNEIQNQNGVSMTDRTSFIYGLNQGLTILDLR